MPSTPLALTENDQTLAMDVTMDIGLPALRTGSSLKIA
jgi:hypothetical protein